MKTQKINMALAIYSSFAAGWEKSFQHKNGEKLKSFECAKKKESFEEIISIFTRKKIKLNRTRKRKNLTQNNEKLIFPKTKSRFFS